MAYAVQVTLGTGNTVSLNYQSQNVSVSVTYQLEREDSDLLAVVQEKTAELAQAHRLAWQGLHDAKVAASQHDCPAPIQTPQAQNSAEQLNNEQLEDGQFEDRQTQEVSPLGGELSDGLSSPQLLCEENTLEGNIPKPVGTNPENEASFTPLAPDEWTTSIASLETAPLEPATDGQLRALRVLLSQSGWQQERITAHLQTQFSGTNLDDLTASQANEWLLELQRASRVANEQQRLPAANQAANQMSRNGAKSGTARQERN